jgi:hypothetical protein
MSPSGSLMPEEMHFISGYSSIAHAFLPVLSGNRIPIARKYVIRGYFHLLQRRVDAWLG